MGFRKKKTLMDQAADIVEGIRPPIESAVETARDKAGPLLTEARDKAGPILTDARDRAVPLINDAREQARPYIAQGRAVATEKAAAGAAFAAETAAAARDAAAARVSELKGEPPKKKGGKFKKLLLLTGIGGLAAFAYKKFTASDDSWQSSYTPAPPPRPANEPAKKPAAATAATAAGDDQGAASPDEALADAAEEPHEVTTPEDPADVVDVDEPGTHKG